MPSLRRLSDQGIARFEAYLSAGADAPLPIHLLTDPDTSEPLGAEIDLPQSQFANRYEFGVKLVSLLSPLNPGAISSDRGLWTALALYWFDQLCSADGSGQRKVDQSYRYVLSADFRHYYRHLVRSPWQLVREHGENSRFLLLARGEENHPLRRHGDILEQLGGTQSIIRSRPIIATAAALYADPITGKPKRGAASKGRGSIRRFARVLRQLELTFDPSLMPANGLQGILPAEFDDWKQPTPRHADGGAATVTDSPTASS